MNPLRAFLFSFTAGLAVLFSGHVAVSSVVAAQYAADSGPKA
jgi:hypothetical protein